jgi:hypothetical protein
MNVLPCVQPGKAETFVDRTNPIIRIECLVVKF